MLPTDNRRKRSLRVFIRRPVKWLANHPAIVGLTFLAILMLTLIAFGLRKPVDMVSNDRFWHGTTRFMREDHMIRSRSMARPEEEASLGHEFSQIIKTSEDLPGFYPDMPIILWENYQVPRTNVLMFNESVQSQIIYRENVDDKKVPYGTNTHLFSKYAVGSRVWLNTFSTFPGVSSERLHGILGVSTERRQIYIPKAMPPDIRKVRLELRSSFDQYPLGYEAALKHGGFYHNLSEALPLDRLVPDFREPICQNQKFNIADLPDASVVITFFNEPFSTLMRTVHSVLNNTPPEIIHEIILVDDHSDYFWAGTNSTTPRLTRNSKTLVDSTTTSLYMDIIEQYIRYLPKVKLLKLPQRRGLVHARLAGARAAEGQVLVVLDSHVEVNKGWLEPQLARIKENPNSIVFPQILSINPETFQYESTSGIGCQLGFKWSMVEQSSMTPTVTNPAPIPSASMAGGLFAVDLEYFWHIGGYDEEFRMWGSENVEMGFRTWMCGGRLECLPCSKTFHIYRKKGGAYSSPPEDIVRNKLRTARLWTDDYYNLARTFIAPKPHIDPGNLDKMIALKERLKCKPFQWYLDNVQFAANNKFVYLKPTDVRRLGELQPESNRGWCLDTMQRVEIGNRAGVFPCHGDGGTQSWLFIQNDSWSHIVPSTNERFCLGNDGQYYNCEDGDDNQKWTVSSELKDDVRIQLKSSGQCLGFRDSKLVMVDCAKRSAVWFWPKYTVPEYSPLKHSAEFESRMKTFGHERLLV